MKRSNYLVIFMTLLLLQIILVMWYYSRNGQLKGTSLFTTSTGALIHFNLSSILTSTNLLSSNVTTYSNALSSLSIVSTTLSSTIQNVETNETLEKINCPQSNITRFIQCATISAMTSKEKSILVELMRHFAILLDYHQIPYFIWAGTLLGNIRGIESIIPYDDDVDVILMSRDREKIREIFKNQMWPNFQDSFFQNSSEHEFSMKYVNLSTFARLRYADRYASPKMYFHEPKCAYPPKKYYSYCFPFLDIFYFDDENQHITTHVYSYTKYNKKNVFPLKRSVFGGFPVWIPNKPQTLFSQYPEILTNCCTNVWWHKAERYMPCSACIPCHCLNGTNYALW